jgi:hypothetical protein
MKLASHRKITKIVFTGAPSSGKSSALERLEGISEKIVVVPETAALLLAGGYPAPEIGNLIQQRIFQNIILNLQGSLESMFAAKYSMATHMVLDRATLDGVGYWPKGPGAYLKEFRIDVDKELKSYDYVLFFDFPPEKNFGGTHEKRFHNYSQSKEVGEKQFKIWRQHKNFIRIPVYPKISDKIDHAIRTVKEIVKI